MAVTWKYAQNQFLRATGGSRPLMLSVASDHSAKLTAHLGSPPDPVIQQCLAGVQPAYDDFQLKVVTWNAISGTREGQTQMLDDLLDELRFIRVKQWNFTVQLTYLDGTPQYTQIFTDGLAPFNSGGKDERILAVQTLATRLAAFPEFASLKTSVETFYASLKSARDTQQGSEGQIKSASDAAEVSRVELAIELYGSLGLLMHKHRKQPQRLTDYFEVPLLRQGGGGSALPPADTGGDEPVLAVFSYGMEQVDATTWNVWIQHPEGVEGVTNVLLVEGDEEFSTDVSLQPGQSQLMTWSGVTIDGEIDEVLLRDADNNVLATGELDETLPNPGP